jgi:hypothetical protein
VKGAGRRAATSRLIEELGADERGAIPLGAGDE